MEIQTEEVSLEGLPVEIRPNLFGLRIRDDSFRDELINEGDIVVLASQTTAENGEVVAAKIDGEHLVIRKYTRVGRYVHLDSQTPGQAPYVRDPGQVEIQGRVISVIRQF